MDRALSLSRSTASRSVRKVLSSPSLRHTCSFPQLILGYLKPTANARLCLIVYLDSFDPCFWASVTQQYARLAGRSAGGGRLACCYEPRGRRGGRRPRRPCRGAAQPLHEQPFCIYQFQGSSAFCFRGGGTRGGGGDRRHRGAAALRIPGVQRGGTGRLAARQPVPTQLLACGATAQAAAAAAEREPEPKPEPAGRAAAGAKAEHHLLGAWVGPPA